MSATKLSVHIDGGTERAPDIFTHPIVMPKNAQVKFCKKPRFDRCNVLKCNAYTNTFGGYLCHAHSTSDVMSAFADAYPKLALKYDQSKVFGLPKGSITTVKQLASQDIEAALQKAREKTQEAERARKEILGNLGSSLRQVNTQLEMDIASLKDKAREESLAAIHESRQACEGNSSEAQAFYGALGTRFDARVGRTIHTHEMNLFDRSWFNGYV